jgi:hypothetical protein
MLSLDFIPMKASRISSPQAIAALILLIAGATLWWVIATRRPQLELGVGYAARVACGCRYIGNRTLSDCRKDFEPGMDAIALSENRATRTITASVPLIASRSVSYDPILACQPVPFTGTALRVHR